MVMVTDCDKGSDNIRLRSGSSHLVTKKTLIWVPMCKEKREKKRVKVSFITVEPLYGANMLEWSLI